MTRENFQNALDVLLDRKPFRPFTVVLVTGDRFEVDYPRALSMRDGVAVYIAPMGIPWLFDHESVSQFMMAQLPEEAQNS